MIWGGIKVASPYSKPDDNRSGPYVPEPKEGPYSKRDVFVPIRETAPIHTEGQIPKIEIWHDGPLPNPASFTEELKKQRLLACNEEVIGERWSIHITCLLDKKR
jgi:hypothetical protein